MPDIKLLGLAISVYTRIARLALEEKNIDYVLQEIDIFADSGPPPDYLALILSATFPACYTVNWCFTRLRPLIVTSMK